MSTAKQFKKMFKGVSLNIEDLFLLEKFQIGYFPGWLPERELGIVLKSRPDIGIFLRMKNSEMSEYFDRIESNCSKNIGASEISASYNLVLWTIADLLVYNKCPEVYDNLPFHDWDFGEITGIAELTDMFVVDGGAGTGRVALEAAKTAKVVYAVEPVTRLRQYIKDKAYRIGVENLFVVDGFLHSLPFPNGAVDVLITSHALGWRLEEELSEFERIVKSSGFVIHCPGTAEISREEETHQRLISSDWGYDYSRYKEADGWVRKYWKRI
jgi:SAM-dependent methyltransferase